MKEIEFRIFDPALNRFWESGRTPKMLAGFFDLHAVLNVRDKQPFEQWIGFSDKNGKKIYEGDILKETPPNVSFHSGPILVRWDEYLCGYIFQERRLERSAPHTNFRYIEVIGNIHENSQLLAG